MIRKNGPPPPGASNSGLKLSRKQLEILTALRDFCRAHGYIPSVRELAQEVGRSATTVYQHLKALEKKGYLSSDGTAHGWQISEAAEYELGASQAPTSPAPLDASATPPLEAVAPATPPAAFDVSGVSVTIRGSIAAGNPIDAIDNPDETLTVPPEIARDGCYALRVRGNSMEEDHILDGDIIIVEPRQTVDNGTIAVALLEDGTATLKRVFKENSQIRLQPANSSMQPFFVPHVTIQGKVTGVIRSCF